MQKDHYRILGVIQDAEDIIIKAAYRALAQRYHPDKWPGSPAEATRRMSKINGAFVVLSDPKKRKQYDQSRASNEYNELEEDSNNVGTEDDLGNSLNENWSEAVKYFTDLEDIINDLSRISKPLAQTYKVYLLENRDFTKRKIIADQLERKFLEKYFGTNEEIIRFSRFLIRWKVKSAAKELNRAINLLGNNIHPKLIINRILDNYPHLVKSYYSSQK
jgi:curved DNA-binding protein CbpA